jgi:ABC-type transport system substrate-binding protein
LTERTRLTIGLLLLLFGLLPGCTTGRKVGENGGNGGAASPSAAANTLRYALTTEPTTLDPATVQDGTTIDLLQSIFEGLVAWDEHNQIVPNIAEKWDVTGGGTVYTFHLKHGVRFHNGREVQADDFKYSLERACNPETKSQTVSSYLNDIVGANDLINGKPGVKEISGVKVLDPYTLQITIDAPKSYWLGKLTYPTGYVVCKEAIAKSGGRVDETSAIGTGPFKLTEFRQGYQVTLAANPDYHNGRPKLDGIARPIIKDATTRLNKYEAGELDIVDVSPRDLDRINQDATLKNELKAFPRAETWYVGLNSAAPGSPFGNRDVRRAFAMAIDKNEIVRVAFKGEAEVANGIVPPGMGNYTSKVKPLPFDPAQARQLLAKAGYPGGKGFPALTLTFRQDQPQVADASQIIASQLKTNLGLDIQLRPMEWGQFLKERDNKTLPLAHLRWAADYLDPQNFLSVLLHTSRKVGGKEDHPENGVGYSNPEFDRLCDQADVEQDPKKREALYQQAEQIAVDDAPWVPTYFPKALELIKPRVGNIRDSLFGHLPHITTTVSP